MTATRERRELPGDALSGGLVADDAVLGVETLSDNLRIDGHGGAGTPSAGPVHRVELVDILTKSAAVESEVEATPKEPEHEGPDKPGRDGRAGVPRGFPSPALLPVVVMIVSHG